ncbi:winged helix-turn-helix domain-containing protein [Streptomyces sp. NPDC060334]|uniref:helix-turn-helix domain-containing protein n=1 Tax=Streptomyces sp. NPDC060334 TaxID=3347099 RepID=UPI00365CFBCD
MSAVAAPAAVMIPAPRASVAEVAVAVLPGLNVPEASQWLSSSAGRIALDGYSWMQAVHWVAGSGLYTPRTHRNHGPRSFGPTTVYIAQLLSELSPCRPGIDYLMRRTSLSRRAVQDHLRMLRETGLLAYIVKGTRVAEDGNQASEFALMVPFAFDQALGIRTVQRDQDAPPYTRAMTGIAEAGRELIAQLAMKAARKVRKPRKATAKGPSKPSAEGPVAASGAAVSDEARCTPMGGSCSGFSTAATISLPSETTDVASGKSESSTRKKSCEKARRGINRVGRRYQLAAELIREIPWLGRTSTPRIAWVVRHVADAGWIASEVQAWLYARGEVDTVHRASGLLATLLRGAEQIVRTPEARAGMVSEWRDSRIAAARRHQEWESHWQAPRSESVRRLVAGAFIPRQEQPMDNSQGEVLPAETGIDDLAAAEVAELRATARGEFMRGETTLITSTVDAFGRPAAERLYGADLVQRALRLTSSSCSSLMTLGHR